MALAAKGITRPDDPGEPHPLNRKLARVSVSEQDAAFLMQIARDRTVCEIGTGLGVSTRAFAETAYSVFTIDIDPWVHETIWPDLPPIVKTGKTKPANYYDLIFIDGAHHDEAVHADVNWALSHGDLIVAHDYHSTREVLDQYGEWAVVNTHYGIGIWLG